MVLSRRKDSCSPRIAGSPLGMGIKAVLAMAVVEDKMIGQHFSPSGDQLDMGEFECWKKCKARSPCVANVMSMVCGSCLHWDSDLWIESIYCVAS
jgi:hypothetical protein